MTFLRLLLFPRPNPLLSKRGLHQRNHSVSCLPSDPDTLCTMCWDKALQNPTKIPYLGLPTGPQVGFRPQVGTKQGGSWTAAASRGRQRRTQPKRAVNREHLFPSSEANAEPSCLSASGRISGKRCDPRLFSSSHLTLSPLCNRCRGWHIVNSNVLK